MCPSFSFPHIYIFPSLLCLLMFHVFLPVFTLLSVCELFFLLLLNFFFLFSSLQPHRLPSFLPLAFWFPFLSCPPRSACPASAELRARGSLPSGRACRGPGAPGELYPAPGWGARKTEMPFKIFSTRLERGMKTTLTSL